MNDQVFLKQYFERYRQGLFETDVTEQLIAFRDCALEAKKRGSKLIFAGNGASAAISSHCAVDYTKQAKVRAIDFNEADLITCFANDYGYEHWVAKAIEHYGDPGDVVVLISSSGRSPNMVRAAEYSRQAGHIVVTFTGQAPDNPLKSRGDINFWLDSKAYNVVESIHQIWLLTICDMLVGDAEYSVS